MAKKLKPVHPGEILREEFMLPLGLKLKVKKLAPKRAAECPSGVVRFRTVVMQENSVEAAITKEGAAELSDIRRCFHPARRFRIEISKFLHLSILFFR